MKIAKVGMGAAVGGVLGLVGTFVVMNLVGYLWSKNNPYNDQGYVTQLFFLSLIAAPVAGVVGGVAGALIVWLTRAPPRVTRVLGWMTLAGPLVVGLACILNLVAGRRTYERAMAGQPPIHTHLPITLLLVGIGCFIFAGIPWAHSSGIKWLKASVLGLIGFVVGGAAGALFGDVFYWASRSHRPHEIEAYDELGWFFGGFWVGGLLFVFLCVRWVLGFQLRYAAEPINGHDIPGHGS